jgi:DMSO/TMAO reductase YedYZ molybdopterin-dependent catalytic subunit
MSPMALQHFNRFEGRADISRRAELASRSQRSSCDTNTPPHTDSTRRRMSGASRGVGNARWGGTPLAPVIRRSGILPSATEVVFWGTDAGEVTVQGGWSTAPGSAVTFTEHFARSMSIPDALAPDNLLCFEMNGEPLTPEHGAPVRLIAPGWYGVANVKWLASIELIDHRYAGRFMARDYVTIREEQRDGQAVWTFASVGHDRLKSAPAKVTRNNDRHTVVGVAWGAPIEHVEVRIDDGPWLPASMTGARHGDKHRDTGYSWQFWTFDWGKPSAGPHTVTSRAFDGRGNVQPAPDDPFLAAKRTYWESNGHITRHVVIA